jgi:GTP:adenosylcobinamide-phosphate guanylyltransferase
MLDKRTAPTILVLAGKRDGRLDPLAQKAGVSHKCRVPIQGKPLLQWVLEAVHDAWSDNAILVSIHDPKAIDDLPIVKELIAAGRMQICEARQNIVESVEEALKVADNPYPLLITTGDNVLVTPEALREIHQSAQDQNVDALFAIAKREHIKAVHDKAQRYFYEFSDLAMANCNGYWMGNDKARHAAEPFRGGGQFIKTKGAILKAFGIINLIRFRMRWWRFDQMLAVVSKRFDVKIAAHIFDDGAYAIDVDNQRTYDIAEMLLAKRKL